MSWLDWVPLLVFPVAAVGSQALLPPWLFMWLMAFTIYAGFKWLTYRDALAKGAIASAGTQILYLVCWPGMSLVEFAGAPALNKRRELDWLAPAVRILAGAGLVWLAVPAIPAEAWLLRGWLGMIGIILMLHFGTFRLLALALQASGLNARPNMQAPLLSRSLAEFWGKRWNTSFHVLANRYGFRPLTPILGPRVALMAVFLVSGLLHEAVITLPARGGYGLPTAYFALQAIGMLVERSPAFRHRPGLKRLFAWLVLVVPLGCLFPPIFLRKVILPMLQTIGVIVGNL
jgi:alginate O-acetyltransferase complex protein AlgI